MAFYIILICTVVYTVVVYSFAKQWHFPLLLPEGLTLLHWNTATSALTTPLINTLLLGVLVSTSSLVLVLFTLESEQLKPARAVAENAFSVSLFLPSIGTWRSFPIWSGLVPAACFSKRRMVSHLCSAHGLCCALRVFIDGGGV